MPNVFRSKEVYKKLIREIHGGNSMVPVRGVYVSGEYTPPYYQDPIVRITNIDSNKPNIANFVPEYVEASTTDTVGLLGFSSEPTLAIQKYTKEYKDIPTTDTVGILGFSISALSVTKFGRDYTDTPTPDTVGLVGYSISSEIKITHRRHRHYDQAPEPGLRLAKIQTSPAVIEKYNG